MAKVSILSQKSNSKLPYNKELRFRTTFSLVTGARGNKIDRLSTLQAVFSSITDENNRPLIEQTNKLKRLRENDLKAYSEEKTKNCKGFVIGRYDKRADKNCQTYFPLIGFDIDGLTETPVDEVIKRLSTSPYVFAAMPSPSFKGLRVFIWCNSTKENHKTIYQHGCEYLSEFLNIPTDKQLRKEKGAKAAKDSVHIDTGTNNISRIWFYSHVPENLFYYNEESEVFEVDLEETKTSKRPQTKRTQNGAKIALSMDEKVKICLDKVNRQNLSSGRNNLVYAVACEMCRHGVPENVAMGNCMQFIDNDFGEPEIRKTVSSAYKAKTFGEFSDVQILAYQKKLNGSNGSKEIAKKEPVKAKETTVKNETGSSKKSKFVQIEEYLFGKYDFRRNIISLEIEYRPKTGKKEWSELNDNDLIIELLRNGWTSVESLIVSILKSSLVPDYDPLKDYFQQLPKWDKKQPDFISQLAGFVKVNDREWFNLQFKKMLVRSAACALNIIPFNKHCFTLVGKQNDGKTSFLRFLCPPKLNSYIKENLDLHNKDGHIALVTNFFINLDELAHLSKYDINKTKAFFTTDRVKERLPYDRKATTFNRRANFLASTNNSEFLTDETGNVRWLVFEIDGIKHDNGGNNGYNQNVNIDMVWAQAFALLQTEFDYKLRPDEIKKSESNNRSHMVVSIEQEIIQRRYKPSSKSDYDAERKEFPTANFYKTQFKLTGDFYGEIQEAFPHFKTTAKNIGKALRVLGFEKEQKYQKEKGYQQRGYYVIHHNSTDENTTTFSPKID